jgi:hypothetical protein
VRVCHSDVSARSHAHMHTCTHACMHTHGTRSGRIVGIECAFSWVIVCGRHGLVAPTERQPHVSCSSVRACQHRGSASNTHTPHTSERMRSSRATNPHPSAPAPPYPSKVGYISLPLPAHVHPMRHPTLAHTHAGTRPQHQTHQTPTHQTHGAKLDPSRTRTRAHAHAHTHAHAARAARTPHARGLPGTSTAALAGGAWGPSWFRARRRACTTAHMPPRQRAWPRRLPGGTC